MMLHIVKLSVGIRDIAHLRAVRDELNHPSAIHQQPLFFEQRRHRLRSKPGTSRLRAPHRKPGFVQIQTEQRPRHLMDRRGIGISSRFALQKRDQFH